MVTATNVVQTTALELDTLKRCAELLRDLVRYVDDSIVFTADGEAEGKIEQAREMLGLLEK